MTTALVLLAIACPVFAQGAKETSAKPTAAKVDLVSRTLERCSKESRRVFFENIVFVGNKVAGMNYGSLNGCLGDGELDKFGERIARSSSPLNEGQKDRRDHQLEKLFSGCSASDRKAFYDGLSFRDGHLVGMRITEVKKCGDGDMARFLSLFGSDGLDASRWKQDCYCKKPHSCVPKLGYACNPDDC